MSNRYRGDVTVMLNNTPYTLRLTLGALAEMEEAFQVRSLEDLGQRFGTKALSSGDVITLLGVALRGGGHKLSNNDVAALPFETLGEIVSALALLMTRTFGETIGDVAANPPMPQMA